MRIRVMYLVKAVLLITLLPSCASYKSQYKEKQETVHFDRSQIVSSIYLIGDGGNAKEGKGLPLLDHLKSALDQEPASSTVLWLGDNIYPHGLSDTLHEEYSLSAHRLTKQLETMDDYSGQVFFIPGNHDWYEYGSDGLRRQEAFVEKYLSNRSTPSSQDKSTFFLPDDGCPDPVTYSINDNIILVVADSQWYVSGYKEGSKSHCKVKTPEQFVSALTDTLSQYKDQTILLSMHHPMFSYGAHGGRHHWVQHIFPLTDANKYLYIPLPVLGSLFHYLRKSNSAQDVNSKQYLFLRDQVLNTLSSSGPHIIVSGHEHTLQHLEASGQYFVVSGSASKSEAVGMGTESKFATSKNGYAKISVLTDGKTVIEYITYDKAEKILFSKFLNL